MKKKQPTNQTKTQTIQPAHLTQKLTHNSQLKQTQKHPKSPQDLAYKQQEIDSNTMRYGKADAQQLLRQFMCYCCTHLQAPSNTKQTKPINIYLYILINRTGADFTPKETPFNWQGPMIDPNPFGLYLLLLIGFPVLWLHTLRSHFDPFAFPKRPHFAHRPAPPGLLAMLQAVVELQA